MYNVDELRCSLFVIAHDVDRG